MLAVCENCDSTNNSRTVDSPFNQTAHISQNTSLFLHGQECKDIGKVQKGVLGISMCHYIYAEPKPHKKKYLISQVTMIYLQRSTCSAGGH